MTQQTELQNPHLEGEAFIWEGGPFGVLLIHGYTATTAEVRPLAKVLHAHGYTVSGPLLPGHGSTPEDANRYRWQDWVAAVETAYQVLAERCLKVCVGGESLGGLLALYLASQHPEAAGVLAYAPALRSSPRIVRLVAPLLATVMKTRPKSRQAPAAADSRWQGYPVNPVGAAVQLFRLQAVVRRSLPAIRQPLLIVQGRLDPAVYPDVPEIIAGEVSSAFKEVHWLERSTHCVILDCEWEKAAEITLAFLDRIP